VGPSPARCRPRRRLRGARSGRGRDRTPAEEAEFFTALCRWGASEQAIAQARAEVLAANDGAPPKVVDLFAGGGAIPLEAARLGCDATAIELNPVAHLIERAMLELPQAHPGLAEDIRRWGRQWVDHAWQQLAGLYPPVDTGDQYTTDGSSNGRRPLAYLWTRTVACPNPALGAHQVHLVRQTWLARKKARAIALRPVVDRKALTIRYEIVEATSVEGLGFDPAEGSKRGQTSCRICGATVTADYVKAEGRAGRLGTAPLAAVVLKRSGRGRDYLLPNEYTLPDDAECTRRLDDLPVDPPEEKLVTGDTMNVKVPLYGLTRFRDLFTPRQLLTLLTLAAGVREQHEQMLLAGLVEDRARAVATCLALALNRVVDRSSTLCCWEVGNETAMHTYGRQALPMVWDFVEPAPYGGAAGDISEMVTSVAEIIETLARVPPARVLRASASALPLTNNSQDAVVTDPPYYDNISYADLSDFFYVWLKRSIGFLYPNDLGGELTPKKSEAIVAPYRHGGNKAAARDHYETVMAASFHEAYRILKPGAPLIVVYAHKTTLGWSTLVDALRTAGFTITEAWPLDTEMPQRSMGQGTASLASSIFLVARKRDEQARVGIEADIMPELDQIIGERLKRLQEVGVTGSDLVIATVGAGLRAFTRYEKVEQDNGEPLPAERFLTLVQGRVLDGIFGELVGADPTTRYYIAAQYSYGYLAVPFDEANNLAHMTGADLDSHQGLTSGPNPLVHKSGSTVALRDFEARGEDNRLGQPGSTGVEAPLIDVAQGLLWLAEHRPSELRAYLLAVRPDAELLRQVVQVLAGRALRSPVDVAKTREAAAAERLLVSWRRLVDDSLFSR
jgi:putative DNA methylase